MTELRRVRRTGRARECADRGRADLQVCGRSDLGKVLRNGATVGHRLAAAHAALQLHAAPEPRVDRDVHAIPVIRLASELAGQRDERIVQPDLWWLHIEETA